MLEQEQQNENYIRGYHELLIFHKLVHGLAMAEMQPVITLPK